MELAFSDCVLDQAARRLTRGGTVVPLEPKMYQLLDVLIRRRPAVVSNSELDELLWPQVYVARTSLTRLVSELRSVLGDTPRDSRIIRTVYKTGYAFAATVTTMSAVPQPLAAVSLVWNSQTVPLVDGENIAGRSAECSIVVDATTVSRRHARITVGRGVATIEDLGSTNGTQVNKVRIFSATQIGHGDEIVLGSEVLTVRMRKSASLTTVVVRRNGTVRPNAGR